MGRVLLLPQTYFFFSCGETHALGWQIKSVHTSYLFVRFHITCFLIHILTFTVFSVLDRALQRQNWILSSLHVLWNYNLASPLRTNVISWSFINDLGMWPGFTWHAVACCMWISFEDKAFTGNKIIVLKTRRHAWQASHLCQLSENKGLTDWNVSGSSYWENDLKN